LLTDGVAASTGLFRFFSDELAVSETEDAREELETEVAEEPGANGRGIDEDGFVTCLGLGTIWVTTFTTVGGEGVKSFPDLDCLNQDWPG
jgi:hypothetical protein